MNMTKEELLLKVAQTLKPLKWTDKRPAEGGRYRALALSPITRYVIVDDGRGVKVIYHNFTEDEPAKTKPGFKSIVEAKDWVQGEHYPKKMLPWLNVDLISIDERLPDVSGRYLVSKDVIGKNEFDVASFHTEKQYFFTPGIVTHWMPLPPPPIGVPHDI